MRKIKLLSAVILIFTLQGCGGGGESGGIFYTPPNYYGAIALNPQTRAAGITARYTRQADADLEAAKLCGLVNCNIVLRFDTDLCAAIARSSNGAVGWASNKSNSDARQTATNQCQSNGGTDCVVLLNECNR